MSPSSSSPPSVSPSSPHPHPHLSTNTPPPSSSPPLLNHADLELMHNFSISTYATLSLEPVICQVWRTAVANLALGSAARSGREFVLRAILAVSAIHLAHHHRQGDDGGQRYLSVAVAHHRVASRQAMGLMTRGDAAGGSGGDVTAEEATDLFLFSSLTVYFALGAPRPGSGTGSALLVGETAFPDWLFLLRGTKAFVRIVETGSSSDRAAGCEDSSVRDQLRLLFTHGAHRWTVIHPPSQTDTDTTTTTTPCLLGQDLLLANLETLISLGQHPAEDLPIYSHAIAELRALYRVFWDGSGSATSGSGNSTPRMDLLDSFIWVHEVADDFLTRLQVPTQPAVAVFLHFCLLLKRNGSWWWLAGWPDHLLERAWGLLELEFQMRLRAAVDEVGWLPP